MNSIGAGSQGDINARVDEQPGRRSRLANGGERFAGKLFEGSSREIFFAKLNEIDAGSGGLANLGEKSVALIGICAGELAPVGNVIKEHERRVTQRGTIHVAETETGEA